MNEAPVSEIKTTSGTAPNLDLERLNAGTLGKFFGAGSSSASNIAGCVAILALVGGLSVNIFLLWNQKESPYEIWKYLAPIVTGALGFIFGKR